MKTFAIVTIVAITFWFAVIIGHVSYIHQETGPGTIACGYSRIGRGIFYIITGGTTAEQIARDTAADPKCHK
jgi:hypothetical protein